ncbi:MAG: hypothetical protein M0018_10615 [Nitrospiraceae bacterium]|nr:hypothetical protein [Nitrospiraceae bacterium]
MSTPENNGRKENPSQTKNICAVCAWRESCAKKFSVSGRDIRCTEFVKDVSIKTGGSRQDGA